MKIGVTEDAHGRGVDGGIVGDIVVRSRLWHFCLYREGDDVVTVRVLNGNIVTLTGENGEDEEKGRYAGNCFHCDDLG